jgi:restriction system protein
MALWLVRAGSGGEYENRFLDENRIYLTWEGMSADLSQVKDKAELNKLLSKFYPNAKPNAIRNFTGQVWPFAKEMKKGDWVVLPSKKKPAIHFAEIVGAYVNEPNNADPFYHYHDVRWIATDIPRSNFDQDLLYSFGAFMTICRISRNDAEKRIQEMAKNHWKSSTVSIGGKLHEQPIEEEGSESLDLEQLAKDQIAKFIIRKFKGHGMAKLIEAILRAQGYFTHRSPEGPDKGIDILAAPGPLGFGSPRLCVQVKTGDSPLDRPTLDQLIGAMQNVNAQQGLLVSWGGFKTSIDKELPAQFFRVRLWDQNSIINELMDNYDKLDEDIRAELPLKRIWTLTPVENEAG